MDEYLAGAFVLAFLLGYLGLAAGIGVYASNRGWSFIFFFLLALFFNPATVFIGLVILDGLWSTTDAETLAEGARSLTQSNVSANEDRSPEPASNSTTGETGDPTEAPDPSSSPNDRPITEVSSADSGAEGDSLQASYEENMGERDEEGKVRCDTCYSVVDESASECPACGADLGSDSFF